MRGLRWLAAVTAVLVFALIVLGATVRATNSGLSCPDWPTCYGHWVPLPADIAALPAVGYSYGQVMLEWLHRLIVGVLLGPLVLAIAVAAFLARRGDPKLAAIGLFLLLLLLIQAGLGAFTVFDANSPWSVAVHLGTALLLLATLLLIVERTAPPLHKAPSRGLVALAVLAWTSSLATMLSAALVAKSGAALACATWPDCNGVLVPDLADPLLRIHFTHRMLAAATGFLLLLLWWTTRRAHWTMAGLARWAGLLVVAQVVLGGIVVLAEAPVALAVLHQALGVLVFVFVTRLMWLATRAPISRKEAGYDLALHGA